ncbi:hypothetical protein A8B79_05970 [Balneola sp. EhC07]|uniref:restriction endonuclease subunit S n=1 Tax=Balneola sp. EhC07 TaxID=1849360 RepID=UPI0007F39055|nr:restriction endonuclease subunit S [Balneola sp. EhC07]OAN61020.1 hypothetical protein A8B79_05970 [Balneola sp. EhC07]
MKYLLSEICEMKSGGTPRRSEPSFYGGTIPWVKIGDFDRTKGSIIHKTEEYLTEKGLNSINNRLFKKGTLLLAMYGSVGKTAFAGTELSSNQAILGITAKKEDLLNLEYLRYWFEFNKEKLVNQGRGVTLNNISATIVKKQEVELPDLQTQQQIVEALDRAQSLIDKRKESIELLNKLLRDTFLNMFGDPVFESKGWVKVPLSSVLDEIESGWSPRCEKYSRNNENEWAVLKQGAVSKRKFIAEENKKLPEGKSIQKDVTATKGDVLFSRKNTPELVGTTAYVFNDHKKLILPDTIFKLVFNPSKVTGLYLYYLFNDSNFRKEVQNLRGGAAGSMPNISKSRLRELEIPLPELNAQKEFDTLVYKVEKTRLKLNSSLANAENLFNSLLQRAFHGDLSFQSELQLDALIENNDVEAINDDVSLIQKLVDRFNQHNQKEEFMNDEGDSFSFGTFEEYEEAKEILFKLMKAEKVEQKYDEENKQTILQMK